MNILKDLLALNERVSRLDPTDHSMESLIEELEKRLAAAKRGLSVAHRLKNPAEKKKHMAGILANMNVIRAQLGSVIRSIEQFSKAEQDYESGRMHESKKELSKEEYEKLENKVRAFASFYKTNHGERWTDAGLRKQIKEWLTKKNIDSSLHHEAMGIIYDHLGEINDW
jgi:ATP-dependent Lon protease